MRRRPGHARRAAGWPAAIRSTLLVLLVLAIAAGGGWAAVVSERNPTGRTAAWVAGLFAIGALLAAFGPELLPDRVRSRAAASPPMTMAEVADQLAAAVAMQWEAEARRQRLNDPHPLPVAWEPADLELVESWDNLVTTTRGWPGDPPPDQTVWASGPAELVGADNDLPRILARVPTGRLLVLGDPGAGKTVLLLRLVLDLLARRAPGGPVPVLVSLAGWDPVDQDLASWLVDRLTLDHGGLTAPAPAGAGAVSRARALLDQRLLLPILDGLDELPEAVWARAVARINDWLPPHQGLVLASRTSAYLKATAPADPADPAAGLPVRVWGAAGIVLRPVDAAAVEAYLRRDAASPAGAARWGPVFAAFGTAAPVAQALTTPLLVSLARTVYNPRPGQHSGQLPDPAELCDTTRLPSRAAVQARLFDAFVPAAYRPRPDTRRQGGWTAAQAERWLGFLARHLDHDRDRTSDIDWWQLHHAVPPSTLRLMPGVVVALVWGLVAGLVVGLEHGRQAGLAFGIAAGLVGGLAFRPVAPPARDVTPARRQVDGYLDRLVFALVFGVGWVLSNIRVNGLWYSLSGAVAVVVFVSLGAGVPTVSVDLTVAADPRTVLARDRRAFLTGGSAIGLAAVLLAAGPAAGLGDVLAEGLGVALVGGLVGVIAGRIVGAAFDHAAWGWFGTARCLLAARGHLPWRLMAFLADAHHRGVLRQAGAVYQFRHLELQRRLATRATDR